MVAGCSPGQVEPTSAPPSPAAATPSCEQVLILPQITEIQPAQPAPGSEIRVIAFGGHIEDTCGGFIEGSRDFALYLDNEPIGSLSCYINHCEGKFTLPENTSTGTHCLFAGEISNAGQETCSFEFQVSPD